MKHQSPKLMSGAKATVRTLQENQNKKAREMSRLVIVQLRKQNARAASQGQRVGQRKTFA